MSNLVQCTRCDKVMMNEEYDQHTCMPKIKSFKTIKFTDYYITKDEHGITTINVITKSGLDLELIEIPENKEYTKIPYQPLLSTEWKQAEESTEDGDSAVKPYLLLESLVLWFILLQKVVLK